MVWIELTDKEIERLLNCIISVDIYNYEITNSDLYLKLEKQLEVKEVKKHA